MFPKSFKNIDGNIFVDGKGSSKEDVLKKSLFKLKKYGSVVIQEYFDENTLSRFENEHENDIKKINTAPNNFTSRSGSISISDSVSKLWFDETLINLIEQYIKKIPIARTYPDVHSVTPAENYSTKVKTDYAGVWHVDHATLIQIAIFLTDVHETGSHMQTIPGTHTYPNITVNGPISSEYVENKKLKIADCVGKRGSVQIHCGNIYHRFFPVKNTSRTWIKFQFCSGTNILFDKNSMGKLIKNKKDLSFLSEKNQKIMSGLVPKNPNTLDFSYNGYDLKNGILVKSGEHHYYNQSPGSYLWKK